MSTQATEIAVRAYSEVPDREPLARRLLSKDTDGSEWTLVFDCETTIDATQQLRLGFYQLRKDAKLIEEGIFSEPLALTETEMELLRQYALTHRLKLLSSKEFRQHVFLKYGYRRHATIVGFNLPFDLSRIAIAHSPARRAMRGGFSFEVSQFKNQPRVRVKHLSPKAALIDFAKPGEQDTPRGMRRRKNRVPAYRGHFVDVKTLAAALLSQRFTLRTLAAHLNTPTQKHDTDAHGQLSKEYLDYARADVQVTWECFDALMKRHAEHSLSKGADRLLSEASVGKAYLQEMNIKPLLASDQRISRERFGEILCAYYGGRAEVRNRRTVHEVLYCDFKSMYPTVNSLMGLWGFVIADGFSVEDSTQQTQQFLDSVSIEDLQRPETWRKLCTLVKLTPDHDLLPVRTKYDDKTYTIGLNYLTSDTSLWYTLADCVVSKLLSGKSPRIEQALTYSAGPPQGGLNSVRILGREDYAIDPITDDLFCSLIDLRDEAKSKGDAIEKTIKIIANSTSYGIFIEVNRDDAPKSELINVFGPDGSAFQIATQAIEEPGRYFHPLLAVLITGAARLMLGVAEKITLDVGLDWAFCDTDSLAIIRPKNISRKQFQEKGEKIVNWFEPLNQYKKPGSILKIETINFGIDSKERRPLYCFAISSKRYALFNLSKGKPEIRKASAHGLGHLMDPYDANESPVEIEGPRVPLSEIGVKRWHYDLWMKIIEAALAGKPDQLSISWHPNFSNPAALRYSASNPELLAWLDKWNYGKHYQKQIRPFGFLLCYSGKKTIFQAPSLSVIETIKRGRPTRKRISPVAPFSKESTKSSAEIFDRTTGERITIESLETYAEALCQYHLSSEDKFLNGSFRDQGRTERRHVVANRVVLIGKEANRVGASGEPDAVFSAVQKLSANARLGAQCVLSESRDGCVSPAYLDCRLERPQLRAQSC